MSGPSRPVITGFSELTLETDDVPGLVAFYRDVLGLPVLAEDADRTWLGVGRTARLGVWSPGRKEFGDRGGVHVHFAFEAAPDRLAALAERLAAAGVEAQGPVAHDGGDRSLYFRDPAGNLVEAWDFFRRPRGRAEGVAAFADRDGGGP